MKPVLLRQQCLYDSGDFTTWYLLHWPQTSKSTVVLLIYTLDEPEWWDTRSLVRTSVFLKAYWSHSLRLNLPSLSLMAWYDCRIEVQGVQLQWFFPAPTHYLSLFHTAGQQWQKQPLEYFKMKQRKKQSNLMTALMVISPIQLWVTNCSKVQSGLLAWDYCLKEFSTLTWNSRKVYARRWWSCRVSWSKQTSDGSSRS